MAVARALLSVSDKTGLIPFARGLAARGIQLISTGGTARAMAEAGLDVVSVADITGFPEMMDGRVKTLHPAVHGGILAREDRPGDMQALGAHGFRTIDLVVANLYPFEATVARSGVTFAEALENIDIGGPTMLRAAAKNHRFVGVVTNPADYATILGALEANDGDLPSPLRLRLAADAFLHTARYDSAIAAYLGGQLDAVESPEAPPAAPRVWGAPLERVSTLRYGENPHQTAGLYVPAGPRQGVAAAEQLQGKPLSYNNWMDLDAAFQLARDLGEGSVAVIKHTNPCGAAVSLVSLRDAYDKARACDPTSSFGGIVATPGVIDEEFAGVLTETFLEVIVASGVTEAARDVLARKKNLRVMVVPEAAWQAPAEGALLPRPLAGATLLQTADVLREDVRSCNVVTERQPTEEEWAALTFAWKVSGHVKSNAIIFSRGDRTVAIGAGQMSRVDSSRIAVLKAQSELAGTAVASDAFFPFPDGVEAAAEAGATAVVQPGGSIRDAAVIEAANRLGLAMVFTGNRHFRH